MTDQTDAPGRPVRPRRSRLVSIARQARRAIPFVLGVLATFAAIALFGVIAPGPAPLTRNDVNQAIATALASVTPPPPFGEQAYAAVRPALVLIQTTTASTGGSSSPGGDLGSGVVINTSGDILTSLHVVADATSITVTFADGTQEPAQITTRQASQDIAVLRAAQLPAGVTPATLGDAAGLRVGSEAYAVGNPFGLTGSMSAGVVSGLDRSFKEPGTGQVLQGLIQIDAAVNPGNSGGPLVDRAGRVLGIVTGLVNPTSQDVFIGIGFAVPINVAGGAAGLPQY